VGAAIGIVGVIFLGIGVFEAAGYTIGGPPTATPNHPILWPVVFFGVLVIGAMIGLVYALRAAHRSWLVIGLLIGGGILALIEGICFVSP
jgi:hypothetical protein